MKNELIAMLVILMNSINAQANNEKIIRISEISPEIQQCIILASAPEDRNLLKMVLDTDCYEQLTEEDKRKIIQIIKTINERNFYGIPLISK